METHVSRLSGLSWVCQTMVVAACWAVICMGHACRHHITPLVIKSSSNQRCFSTCNFIFMQWADLAGAHFEGALLSSSDIGRICENPVRSLSDVGVLVIE
jgi:hypothetical protein